MMSTVRSFSVGYNPINESNVFSSGDYISRQVTLELAKDTVVKALSVKMKGKAEVRWTEDEHGKQSETYFSKEKYFSVKQFLIQEGQETSFKGAHGNIQYTLEAHLSRSMRIDSKAKAEFNLVSKGDSAVQSSLRVPQHGATEKKMKLFNSGYVAMEVDIDKTGLHQGEGIKVVASIHNKSKRDVRPKYCVYRKCSFFAMGKMKLETNDLLKEVGDAVPPSTGQTVTKFIIIPATTSPSMFDCNIIKLEYRLRVYLDVKYATDPEVKFPIIILPPAQRFDEEVPPVCPTYGFESFPSVPTGNIALPYPGVIDPSAPPPPPYEAHGAYGIYPSLPSYGSKS